MLHTFLWLVLGILQLSTGDDALVRLYKHLLVDYVSDIRPSIKHDQPINVTFSFSLTQIIDLDERNQIITTNAWVRQDWFDYKLIWNPLDYENVTKMHIPYEKVWKPDIILYTNADSAYSKSVMSTDVIVSYDGNVTWSAAGIFKSSCQLDVRYYPFDTQNCVLKFASWAYDGTKIDIILASETMDQTNYLTSSEWILNLIKAKKNSIVYSCCPEPYPFIDIHISIQRRPLFYVFNLILPCVLISCIALLGFYMPSDSGEKVTLGITSLLSTTVFLMLVAEGMPPTSDALPLIGLYYGVTIFIVSLATAMTVFTLNIHHYGVHGSPVPALIQNIAFNIVAKILCLQIEEYHSINDHVHYFFEKENENNSAIKISLSSESMRPYRPQMSHVATTNSLLAETEMVIRERSETSLQTDVVKRKKSELSLPETENEISLHSNNKKRVSFSTDSIYSLAAPNGACSQNGPGLMPPAVPSTPFDSSSADVFEEEFFKVLSKVQATIERNEMRLAEKDRRNAAQLEWQQVALVLDRFLLIVFVIGTAVTSLAIIYQRQLTFS